MSGIERVISKLGREREFYTPTGGTRNKFGQQESKEEYSLFGSVFCYFESEPRETVNSSGGSRTEATPKLLFFSGEAPQAGARVEVGQNYYEIESPTAMTTHEVATAALVESFNP